MYVRKPCILSIIVIKCIKIAFPADRKVRWTEINLQSGNRRITIMEEKKQNLETICIQGGWQPKNGEPRVLPIYQSTTFKYECLTKQRANALKRMKVTTLQLTR